MKPISIESIVVGAGRMTCDVVLAPSAPRSTSPQIIERATRSFPTLMQHACVNEKGPYFGSVMNCTPLPHLLEHLVIDLQTRRSESDFATFVGTTEWIDETAGKARVEVSFTDDLVALRAFRDAVNFLNDCVIR